MEPRRVVVTGIGAVTPIGHGKDGLWNGIREGRSGIGAISRFDTSQIQTKVAAEINDFDPLNFFDGKLARRMDRFAQLGIAACDMAVEDSGLGFKNNGIGERTGVTMGTALGGIAGAERQHEQYISSGLRAVEPTLALTVFGGSGSSNIAIRYGLTGPSNANSNSCASGTMAIGEAYRYIKDDYADIMIAASAEAPLYELTFSAFTLIRSMSTNKDPSAACRPFDKNRDGFVMGEAAAVLVLEEFSHAVRRDARIYCEILGYSSNNDAHHMVAPRPDAASTVRAMQSALREAKIHPSDIAYVNAHGSSTVLNDNTESFALKRVFGDHTNRLAVSSTKSMHGHALGASGAVEAAICCQVFGKEFLPPTIHYSTPDPDCDLDYIPNRGRDQRVDYILSNSFGFGGINACLVLGRVDQ